MRNVTRIPLEDGGSILFEADPQITDGPVKAGRVRETIQELPQNLQSALIPVTNAARTVLDHLREASPDAVEVEFGLDLAASAGAIITKSEGSCHIKVKLSWKQADPNESRA